MSVDPAYSFRRWTIAASLRLKQWPDEAGAVVFDPVSGDTHAIGAVEYAILSASKGQHLSLGELAQRVAASQGVACDGDLLADVEDTLDHLRQRGLAKAIIA